MKKKKILGAIIPAVLVEATGLSVRNIVVGVDAVNAVNAVNAEINTAAGVVLPIPMSPATSKSAPESISSSATACTSASRATRSPHRSAMRNEE